MVGGPTNVCVCVCSVCVRACVRVVYKRSEGMSCCLYQHTIIFFVCVFCVSAPVYSQIQSPPTHHNNIAAAAATTTHRFQKAGNTEHRCDGQHNQKYANWNHQPHRKTHGCACCVWRCTLLAVLRAIVFGVFVRSCVRVCVWSVRFCERRVSVCVQCVWACGHIYMCVWVCV